MSPTHSCCFFFLLINCLVRALIGESSEQTVLRFSRPRDLASVPSKESNVEYEHKYLLWPFYNLEVFNGWWNRDYLNELFPPPFFITGNDTEYPIIDMVLCSGQEHVPEIEKVITRLKSAEKTADFKLPVLLHTSDEFMGSNPSTLSCTKFYSHFHVVLREYALHGHHPDNVHQLPLGFMVNSLFDNVTISSAVGAGYEIVRHPSISYAKWSLNKGFHARELQWAFVGGIHGKGRDDRNSALNVFSSWSPHFRGEGVTAHKMMQIYNNSRFVLNGRGWNTLDCYRIYEALIAGALPVVVGEEHELSHSFAYEGHRPPLIYERSWPEALQRCQAMNESEWNAQRTELVRWYMERVSSIRSLTYKAMGLPAPVGWDASFSATIQSPGLGGTGFRDGFIKAMTAEARASAVLVAVSVTIAVVSGVLAYLHCSAALRSQSEQQPTVA